jgi:trimethylamine--corrinoid protein Co-methyltransferase
MVEVVRTPAIAAAAPAGGPATAPGAGTAAIHQMPWTIPQNQDAPVEPLRPEQIEGIHNGAMRILEEIGILFLNEDALKILKQAGCDVDFATQRVRMDRAFVMEQVAKAPSTFDITPRNPNHKVSVGGDAMLFVNVSSPPNAMDLDRGRRPGDRESFRDLMKLTQYFNCIHLAGGYPVEPVDLHASVRHLECLYDKLTLTIRWCTPTRSAPSGWKTRWRWCASPAASPMRSSTPARGCTPTSTPPRR